MSALQSYAADNQGDLSALAPAGGAATYSTSGTASGFSGYIGKLSQTVNVEIHGANNSVPSTFNASSVVWLKANPSNANGNVYVSIGNACVSGSSGYGTSTSTDASVYALLSNGTVYCASM